VTIRRLARDVLIYGSGDVVLRAAALLTLPIYSRLLEPAEFGIWSFLITLTFLLNVVLVFGGDAALARYFFATDEHAERRLLTSTLIAFVAAASALAVLLLLPFSDAVSRWAFGSDENADLIALALVTAPVTAVSSLLGQVLRNEFRPAAFALQNIATAVIGVALSLYLVMARDLGVKGVLLGTLAGALAVLPIRVWSARAYLAPVFSSLVLRRLLAFGLPLVPAAFAGWVFTVSDRIVLAKLASYRELGLYAVAASIASVLSFLIGPLGLAWSPHAVQAYERDEEAAASLYGRVLTYILLGFGSLAVAVTVFAPELLALLTPPEFADASKAIGPLALAAVAFATVQITSAGISLRHRTAYIAGLTAAAAVVNIALNLAFVPVWGMLASAWATAATSVALTVAYAHVAGRLWRVRYETRRTALLVAWIVAFTLGAQVLPELDLAVAVPLKLAYCLAFVAALFASGALDTRETRALWTLPLFRQLRP
jgi:O-antigen/teichoic acid export membrane protein